MPTSMQQYSCPMVINNNYKHRTIYYNLLLHTDTSVIQISYYLHFQRNHLVSGPHMDWKETGLNNALTQYNVIPITHLSLVYTYLSLVLSLQRMLICKFVIKYEQNYSRIRQRDQIYYTKCDKKFTNLYSNNYVISMVLMVSKFTRKYIYN